MMVCGREPGIMRIFNISSCYLSEFINHENELSTPACLRPTPPPPPPPPSLPLPLVLLLFFPLVVHEYLASRELINYRIQKGCSSGSKHLEQFLDKFREHPRRQQQLLFPLFCRVVSAREKELKLIHCCHLTLGFH